MRKIIGIILSILVVYFSTAPASYAQEEPDMDELEQMREDMFLHQINDMQQSFNEVLLRNLPYTVSSSYDANNPDIITFNFHFEQNSYIYKDSVKLVYPDDVVAVLLDLPQGIEYEDSQGKHIIFKYDFSVKAQIVKSRQGQFLHISYQGCNDKGICYPAMKTGAVMPNVSNEGLSLVPKSGFEDLQEEDQLTLLLNHNFTLAMMFSVAMGVLLNLTPCVIVLLPIFSAMISGHRSHSMGYAVAVNGAYTMGLSLSYMCLGLLLSVLGANMQIFLQHPAVLYAMAIILVACAASSAGLFSVNPPQRVMQGVQNTMARQSRGTVFSAFLFGVLSSVLTTPCTSAPLAGIVLYILQDGDVLRGSLSFFAVGLGMALPLFFIGIFGVNYLDKLKRQSVLVKKIVASMLLGLAYYLIKDHLGRLHQMVFIVLIFFISTFILFELFSNLSQNKSSNLITSLSCAMLICAGLYSFTGGDEEAQSQSSFTTITRMSDLSQFRGQKVYLHFTANWCTNCHAMREGVYDSPEFQDLARNNNVKLLEFDITDVENEDVQDMLQRFQIIGVPYFLLLDEQGEVLGKGVGFKSFEDIKTLMASRSVIAEDAGTPGVAGAVN